MCFKKLGFFLLLFDVYVVDIEHFNSRRKKL